MNSAVFSRRSSRISLAGRHYVSLLAWGLALAFAAWVAVDLFWRLAAPAPVAFHVQNESDAGRSAEMVGARHLMGEPVLASDNIDQRFALYGVVTGDEQHPGFAVLAIDGVVQGIVLGQEVATGVVLSRILPDSVELGMAGGVRRVALVAGHAPEMPPEGMQAAQ